MRFPHGFSAAVAVCFGPPRPPRAPGPRNLL